MGIMELPEDYEPLPSIHPPSLILVSKTAEDEVPPSPLSTPPNTPKRQIRNDESESPAQRSRDASSPKAMLPNATKALHSEIPFDEGDEIPALKERRTPPRERKTALLFLGNFNKGSADVGQQTNHAVTQTTRMSAPGRLMAPKAANRPEDEDESGAPSPMRASIGHPLRRPSFHRKSLAKALDDSPPEVEASSHSSNGSKSPNEDEGVRKTPTKIQLAKRPAKKSPHGNEATGRETRRQHPDAAETVPILKSARAKGPFDENRAEVFSVESPTLIRTEKTEGISSLGKASSPFDEKSYPLGKNVRRGPKSKRTAVSPSRSRNSSLCLSTSSPGPALALFPTEAVALEDVPQDEKESHISTRRQDALPGENQEPEQSAVEAMLDDAAYFSQSTAQTVACTMEDLLLGSVVEIDDDVSGSLWKSKTPEQMVAEWKEHKLKMSIGLQKNRLDPDGARLLERGTDNDKIELLRNSDDNECLGEQREMVLGRVVRTRSSQGMSEPMPGRVNGACIGSNTRSDDPILRSRSISEDDDNRDRRGVGVEEKRHMKLSDMSDDVHETDASERVVPTVGSSESKKAIVEKTETTQSPRESSFVPAAASEIGDAPETLGMKRPNSGSERSPNKHDEIDPVFSSSPKLRPAMIRRLDDTRGISKGDILLSLLNDSYQSPGPGEEMQQVRTAVMRMRTMRQRQNSFEQRIKRKQRLPLPVDVDEMRVVNSTEHIRELEANAVDYLEHDKFEEARELYEEIVNTYKEAFLEGDSGTRKDSSVTFDAQPYIGTSLYNIGILYFLTGSKADFRHALRCFEQSSENRKSNSGETSTDYLTTLSMIALCYYALGDLQAAERGLEAVIEDSKRFTPKISDSMRISEVLNNLGCISFRNDRHETALVFFRDALDIQQSILKQSLYGGPKLAVHDTSLRMSVIRSNIGCIQLCVNDITGAILSFEAALARQYALLSAANSTAVATMDHLAIANLHAGNKDQAIRILTKACSAQLDEYGARDSRVAESRKMLNKVIRQEVIAREDIERMWKGQIPCDKTEPPSENTGSAAADAKDQSEPTADVAFDC